MANIININSARLTSDLAPTIGGYVALGTIGEKFAVLSKLSKSVVKLSPSSLKEMDLKALCGATWCDENFSRLHPKKEEWYFDHRELANEIIRECQAKGPYLESYERKTGVWVGKDGQLLINSEQLWNTQGDVFEHGIHDDRIYSANGNVGFSMATPEASDEEVRKVIAAFGGINWRQPLGA